MQIIKDKNGKVICKADPQWGLIETKYQKMTVRTTLAIGESISIEREDSVTRIIRVNRSFFCVKHIA